MEILNKQPGIKYGIIGGLAVVFYFAIFWQLDKAWFIHPGVQWSSLAIYIACMYKAAQDDYAQHGIARDFRALLREPFIAFLLINLCYWLFYYAIHLADPGLLQMEFNMQLAYLKEQLTSGVGDPQQANQLREQIGELERAMARPAPQPLGPVVMRMAVGAIGGAALAAGIAAWLRSRA